MFFRVRPHKMSRSEASVSICADSVTNNQSFFYLSTALVYFCSQLPYRVSAFPHTLCLQNLLACPALQQTTCCHVVWQV